MKHITSAEHQAIVQRLRSFGKENYQSFVEFARALGINYSALKSNYLAARAVPGGEILARLHHLGCDISWLLTGEPYSTMLQKRIGRLESEKRELKACLILANHKIDEQNDLISGLAKG